MRHNWCGIFLVLMALTLPVRSAELKLGGFDFPGADGQLAPLRFHGAALVKSLELLAVKSPAPETAEGRPDLHLLPVTIKKSLAHLQSNEWAYAQFEMPAGTNRAITRWVRHLLMVDPDVLVMYDEIQTVTGASGDWQFTAAVPMKYDASQKTLNLDGERCGATARVMNRSEKPKEMVVPTVDEERRTATVHWTATQPEVRLLLVLVAHDAGQKRALDFKRLDSLNAAGLRVHRDGYPTLIAIRNSDLKDAARLGGLDFQSPAAVYVDKPKKKK